MFRKFWSTFALFAAIFAFAAPIRASDSADEQQTVNAAAATIERMKGDKNFQKDFQPVLNRAKAVLIVPNLYKGGFVIGAQYGNGVLLTRRADSWSYPAFYNVSGASLGLQIGVAGSSIMFMILTDAGLKAMMQDQFKFGADASITFVVVGAGIGGSSTTAAGADIAVFALGGVGLYGGMTVEGTVVSPRESWNQNYYGRSVTANSIVFGDEVSNANANILRDILSR